MNSTLAPKSRPKGSSSKPAKQSDKSPFRFATRWLKEAVIYVAAISALLVAILKLQKRFKELYPGCPTWVWITAASVPLLAVIFTRTIPALVLQQRERKLRDWGAQNAVLEPRYFRLAPYEESIEDQRRFTRPDGFQNVVLNWLVSTNDKVLFLTGTSGAGKSSLLNAAVLPKLREMENGFIAFQIRAALGDAAFTLKQEILRPGAVWKQPPESLGPADLSEVIAKAGAHIRPKHILVVFDQFEEVLLTHERKPEDSIAFRALIDALDSRDFEFLKILLVLRSDYIGMSQSGDWASQLPQMREDVNWREVSAFREKDARRFLEDSGLSLGPRLIEEIFEQISETEGTVGLVRPITVNMVGLALDSFSGNPVKLRRLSTKSGGLLANFIREQISYPEISKHAPGLLREMVDRSGMRRARTINELCRQTEFSREVVVGCLLQLLRRGVVRVVSEQRELWEISHDFVARILEYVLNSWRASFAQRLRKVALPSAAFLWVFLFSVLPLLTAAMRKVPISSLSARFEIGTGPGDPCPPALGASSLDLEASSNHNSVKGEWGEDSLADPEVKLNALGVNTPIQYDGESTERSCSQTINYSQFEGSLGNLDHPNDWKNPWIEGIIRAHANDGEWQSFIKDNSSDYGSGDAVTYYKVPATNAAEFKNFTDTGVEGKLTVLMNGQAVWSQSGLVLITGGSYHGMPLEYTIRFLPAQVKSSSAH